MINWSSFSSSGIEIRFFGKVSQSWQVLSSPPATSNGARGCGTMKRRVPLYTRLLLAGLPVLGLEMRMVLSSEPVSSHFGLWLKARQVTSLSCCTWNLYFLSSTFQTIARLSTAPLAIKVESWLKSRQRTDSKWE